MTAARVIKVFKGVPDGESAARTFHVGDEVEGDLARVALREGWAEVAAEPAAVAEMPRAAPRRRRRRKGADA